MNLRNTDAIVLVFDVNYRESFDDLKNYWLKEVKDKAPENTVIMVLGNKSEKTDEKSVS